MKKKSKKIEKKEERNRNRGYVLLESVYDCGCCYAKMRFKSIASAEKAFKEAGLDLSATIIDDAGDKHEGIDTFYGFCKVKK